MGLSVDEVYMPIYPRYLLPSYMGGVYERVCECSVSAPSEQESFSCIYLGSDGTGCSFGEWGVVGAGWLWMGFRTGVDIFRYVLYVYIAEGIYLGG